ncbi:MAG: hypothetical protein CFE24_13640 [Flavobacterium sp. BFFFF2]|nr:MAG: hypothetical protein CFE24_13640 [Flavobacterium sp. BFFFF2]
MPSYKGNSHFCCIIVLLFVFIFGFAQKNEPYNGKKAFQKSLQIPNVTSKEEALGVFAKTFSLEAETTFKLVRETQDLSGSSHTRYQQFYKHILVEFGTAIVHKKANEAYFINGEVYKVGTENAAATWSAQSAFAAALSFVNAQKYRWEQAPVKSLKYTKPTGTLVWLPLIHTGDVRLAYMFDIYAVKPLSRDKIYIDAQTGKVLLKSPILIHHATAADKESSKDAVISSDKRAVNAVLTANADTRYHGSQNIETSTNDALEFVLNDLVTVGGVYTYNCQATSNLTTTDFTDNDNNWSAAEFNNAAFDNAALDAHWGAEKTLLFWKNIFNRNSYDDQSTPLTNYVHYDDDTTDAIGYDNAFWDGAEMVYGDGNNFQPLTALDVCGHEIGHGVCQETADLVYRNQSGALNEALSDIWGACVEQYGTLGNLNAPADGVYPGNLGVWKVGEDISPNNCLRSMSYPKFKSDPDTYLGAFYIPTADDGGCDSTTPDHCGVHTNSGVINHWFYILSAGKTGTNDAPANMGGPFTYHVTGIGMEKAATITYFAERDYLTPNATFMDFRNATLQAAYAIYCFTGNEVEMLTKAWKAVNVGNDYVAATVDIGIANATFNGSYYCDLSNNVSNVLILNNGINAVTAFDVTYQFDSNAPTTIHWNGNLAACSSTHVEILQPTGLTGLNHHVSVSCSLANDQNAQNNIFETDFKVNRQAPTSTVITFDTAADDFIALSSFGQTSALWERGTVNKTNFTNSVAGSKVLATGLTSNYPNLTTSYLLSPCFQLAGLSSATVQFDMAFDLEENYDVLYMQYTTDFGSTWQTLGSYSNTWYNSNDNNCANCRGGQWTGLYSIAPAGGNGQNGNKRHYTQSLNNLLSADQIVFRFVFKSDELQNFEGVFIDNFVVQGTLSDTQFAKDSLKIVPNPSAGVFTVYAPNFGEAVQLKLYDVNGRLVFQERYDTAEGEFAKQMNVSHLEAGVYFVQLVSGTQSYSDRLLINNH